MKLKAGLPPPDVRAQKSAMHSDVTGFDDRTTPMGLSGDSRIVSEEKVWTEAEILADNDLWHVTDSDESDDEFFEKGKKVEKVTHYDARKRNKQFYSDPD